MVIDINAYNLGSYRSYICILLLNVCELYINISYLPIVNFPFICSNIPAISTHRKYISQFVTFSLLHTGMNEDMTGV
jgi:hypothetical protein